LSGGDGFDAENIAGKHRQEESGKNETTNKPKRFFYHALFPPEDWKFTRSSYEKEKRVSTRDA
jgi:hypothetical protein